MSEQAHGLRVEPVPRRPGVAALPAARLGGHSVTEFLPGLDPAAQHSVAEVLTHQHRQHPLARAAIQSAVEADIEADRAGAT